MVNRRLMRADQTLCPKTLVTLVRQPFFGETKKAFFGADLRSAVPGAQGGSNARSGTAATRTHAQRSEHGSMARTRRWKRPSTGQHSDQVAIPDL